MKCASTASGEKLRGGYYTPPDLAMFLVKWIEAIQPGQVLEPSCGDGVFLSAMGERGLSSKVVGFEIDKGEAATARRRAAHASLNHCKVIAADFLEWSIKAMNGSQKSFDAIVGNPPFIRYQYLPSDFQKNAENIFSLTGCHFTRHTNAWVPFLLSCTRLLAPGGRLAMVVPSEILHVSHAKSLRSYLTGAAKKIVLIDPLELWFENLLQGTVLLLLEKKRQDSESCDGIAVHPVQGRRFLNTDPSGIFKRARPTSVSALNGKWTPALLPSSTVALLDKISANGAVRRFSDVADVDVGIVTGANDFFLVSNETIDNYRLHHWAHPMFGKSNHCPGIVYDRRRHQQNEEQGLPTNFVWLKDSSTRLSSGCRRYIKLGEEHDLHSRYKCRVRNPWYLVPSVYATDVGLLKRSHDAPRLILNKIRAFTTDTAYRVRTRGMTPRQLVYSFINPLTALSSELEGRHYGGGVLELVPSEIERLLIPLVLTSRPCIGALDKLVKTQPMEKVLAMQSNVILGRLGIAKKHQEEVLDAWVLLRNRRQRVQS